MDKFRKTGLKLNQCGRRRQLTLSTTPKPPAKDGVNLSGIDGISFPPWGWTLKHKAPKDPQGWATMRKALEFQREAYFECLNEISAISWNFSISWTWKKSRKSFDEKIFKRYLEVLFIALVQAPGGYCLLPSPQPGPSRIWNINIIKGKKDNLLTALRGLLETKQNQIPSLFPLRSKDFPSCLKQRIIRVSLKYGRFFKTLRLKVSLEYQMETVNQRR